MLGAEVVIKTNQISLKYLLEQRVNTPMQHKGLSKLLGLNYTIEYKKGVENRVADALSRQEGQNREEIQNEADLCMVSEIIPTWVQELKSSYEEDQWIAKVKREMESGIKATQKFSEHQGVVRYNGRICVGEHGNWREKILREMHGSSLGGHAGITATYQRVKRFFFLAITERGST